MALLKAMKALIPLSFSFKGDFCSDNSFADFLSNILSRIFFLEFSSADFLESNESPCFFLSKEIFALIFFVDFLSKILSRIFFRLFFRGLCVNYLNPFKKHKSNFRSRGLTIKRPTPHLM